MQASFLIGISLYFPPLEFWHKNCVTDRYLIAVGVYYFLILHISVCICTIYVYEAAIEDGCCLCVGISIYLHQWTARRAI